IFNRRYIQPVFSKGLTKILLLLSVLFSVIAQWYTLNYLPVADCLPLKAGNSIPEQMKIPANAIPDSTVITFVYAKEGKNVEFTAETFPEDFNDSTYTFVDRYDKVIRAGVNNEPPLKAFGLTAPDGSDRTQDILNSEKAMILF